MKLNLSPALRLSIGATAIGVVGAVPCMSAELPKQPKLVVGIVVEGLSNDYLDLLRPQFVRDGGGGFIRLADKGVSIPDVDFGTPLDGAASTAVIFTGAAPAVNGIAASTVYDRESRRPVATLNDASILGNFTNETLSPSALGASTLSD